MSDIIDDYLQEVRRSLEAGPREKRQILRELRSHAEDRVDDLRSRDPDLGREEAAQQVLRDLGSPRDLALSYGPEGKELKNDRGETLFRIGRAAAEGTKTVAKAVGIVLAVLLVVALVVGAWAWYEVVPEAKTYAPYEVYDHSRNCQNNRCSSSATDTFSVHEDARDVKFEVSVLYGSSNLGQVDIQVTDPSGNTRMDRTYSGSNGDSQSDDWTWGPEQGEWTVQVDYTAFQGTFSAHGWTIGAPGSGSS